MSGGRMIVLLGFVGSLILSGILPSVGHADVPLKINYQGYLRDSGGNTVVNGSYEMIFSVYDVPIGGTALWSGAQTVVVQDGVFSVVLGQVSNELVPADFNGQRYLGVKVEGDYEMSPRQLLTSVPTALVSHEANNARTLNGIDSATFLTVEGGSMIGSLELPQNGLVVGTDQLVITNDGVGIGTSTPGHELTVAGTIESTSGGVKFPDGTVQTSAAAVNNRNKVLALGALLDRYEFGATFPSNVFDHVPCSSDALAGISFSFSLAGSPLGEVVGFMGEDRISDIYNYSVAIKTPNGGLRIETIVGTSGALIYRRGKTTSSFPGIITEFGLVDYDGNNAIYVARLEPAFAKLKWSVGSGAYMQMSLSDIILAELSLAGLQGNISVPSRVLEGEMRYNESRAAFLCRLMEREGCHYHFNNALEGSIVVGDTNSSFSILGGALNYYGYLRSPGTDEVFITSFHHKSSLLTNAFVLTGWDYKAKERAEARTSTNVGIGDNHEYWADATQLIAQDRAQANMEREMMLRHHYTGTSNSGTLRAGKVFNLVDQTGGGLDGSYLVTGVRHIALYDDVAGCFMYCNAFSAIPSYVRFRPERKTPHPRPPQIVTAIVTNNNDPDQLGRVKVKFPWNNNIESMWARVISSIGHKNADGIVQGQTFIPAVDNEVMVTFLQGNPTLPVVLGCVHNGKDLPPPSEDSIVAIGSDGSLTINSPGGITISSAQAVNISSGQSINLDSSTGNLALAGYRIDLGADTVIKALANTELQLQAAASAKIESGADMDIRAGALMNLNGSLLRLNGGGSPAARFGDMVNTPLYQPVGTIVSGSATVQIGP